MSDEPTTQRHTKREPGESRGPASMPITVVASLLSAVLAGGGGSYLTGSSMSTTMREGQIRLEAQVTQLREDVRRIGDDQRAALERIGKREDALDERMRAVEREVWAGRSAPSSPR